MSQFKGIPASPGFAQGRAYVYRQFSLDDTKTIIISPNKVKSEEERLHHAVTASIEELERTKDRILHDLGESETEIIDAHLTMLQDASFLERIKKRVVTDLVNVEKALASEVSHLERLLSKVESDYLRERSADFRDIGNRVLRKLVGDTGPHPLADLGPGTILVAAELLPLDTLALKRENVVGIITERGGATSHTAILARALGVPLVTGISHLMVEIQDGDRLLVNGDSGLVTVSPTESQRNTFGTRAKRYEQRRRSAMAQGFDTCRTRDGVEIRLLANINDTAEAGRVQEFALDGVGLFRTEFIFLQTDASPTLAQHCRIYRKAASQLGDRPCTIRSFDLGDDKLPNFMLADPRIVPHQGQRGLRFALAHRKLFRTQLRGIARASRDFPGLRVMFPMVLGRQTLDDAITLFREACASEGLEGCPPIGAMLETPAALFDLDAILERVDFLSVGTNDLTQYMLAVSRGYADQVSFDATRHPSVLRALQFACKTADAHSCPIGICGEAAGVPELATLFVGLGYRQLSMSPVRTPDIRHALSRVTLAEAEARAAAALDPA